MSTPEKKRRIVRMSKLAEHGYEFSAGTCYEWCAQTVDPMPHIDMSKPGTKHKQYFVDLDELDLWLERRKRGGTTAPTESSAPAEKRRARRSHAAECEALGIEADHAFM